MKATVLVRLGVLLACLVLVGISPQIAKTQVDTTIVTDTLYSTSGIDGSIWYSEFYSTLFVVTTADEYSAGDALGWDMFVGGENYTRSYLCFDLSSLPDSIIVVEASVNLYQWLSIGNDTRGVFPIWDVPGGDTLFCIMDHINYGAYLDTLDWGAGDPGNPKTLTSNIGVLSDDATIEYKTLDVTRYVQADIDAERRRSQFRIRFPIDTDHDERGDWLDFYSSSSAHYPPLHPYMPVRYKKHNAVEEWGDYSLPVKFRLEQNFPNPFNVATTIRYHLPAVSSRLSAVSLKIYNILGKEVITLVDKKQKAGSYRVVWDGRDNQGKEVSSGVYLCRLEVRGDGLKVAGTRKMVLLK